MSDNVKSWMFVALFFVAAAAAILFLWRPEMAAVWFWGEMGLLFVIVVAAVGYSHLQKQIEQKGQLEPS